MILYITTKALLSLWLLKLLYHSVFLTLILLYHNVFGINTIATILDVTTEAIYHYDS